MAKLPYEYALDGISNTQTINPSALGQSIDEQRVTNLVNVMDGYFANGAHHLNVNVFGVEKLKDAMEHPEKPEYANFTIRVSGYAVKFIDLTREQQLDVIARTCHDHTYRFAAYTSTSSCKRLPRISAGAFFNRGLM